MAAVARQDGTPLLARGMGRAYGDAALLSGGFTLLTERLDRFLGFDPETGWLRCEAGVTIADIIRSFLPRGFFPPVVPGTRFVSVAGALASDIHGKNHHVAGSWSSHVRGVEVLTASGEVAQCDSDNRSELFRATAGGMGLTAIILSMEVRLAPVDSSAIEMESIRVRNLDEFFEVSAESSDWPYTVGWVDSLKSGASLGRGMFMRGRHAPTGSKSQAGLARLVPPLFLNGRILESNLLLNRATVRIFNAAYYRKNLRRTVRKTVSTGSFFFPLDTIANWNRMYGRRGFLQYQFVMPPDPERRGIRTALAEVAGSGVPSFLGVIKEFGDEPHGGLSFPIPGVTVALDFPNVGERLFQLLERLDDLVAEAGGRVYLAKDARLNKKNFRRMYPDWERWKSVRDAVDPSGIFQSELGRRLGLVGE